MSHLLRSIQHTGHGSGRRPSELRFTLRALITAVATLAVISAIWFLAHLRDEMIQGASVRAEAGARLLEEHVLRTFRTTEFLIDRLGSLAQSLPMDRLVSSREVWAEMVTLQNGLPEPGTLWIADADGRIVLGSTAYPTPHNDITDRYYFQVHKRGRVGLTVGPLVATKSRGLQAFHLSKRIEDRDGNFLGVAVAGVDAPYFTDFHHSLGLGPQTALSIIGLDGRVVMRQPDPGTWVDKSVAGGPVMTAIAGNPTKGIILSRSPLDGVERIAAYRVVGQFGVVAVCSIALDDALHGWWEAMAMTGAGLAGIAAVLGALAIFAFRTLAREEALMVGLEARIRERTEEANFQADQARRANQTKTRFLAAASHDLRQPLQAAGMFVEALAVRLNASPHMAVVEKLRQSIDATQALLSTLLDASTLEAGGVEANVTTFPLAPLLATLIDQMEPEATQRGLSLRVVPCDAWVVSDPVLLERMLRNLLVNALRYTERGGILLGCRRRGDTVAIQVADTGRGIPADKLEAVFDDFTRLREDEPTHTRGLGLGLSVVRRMAVLMHHDLEVHSIVGRGSIFGIVVPRAQRRLSSGEEAISSSPRVMAANATPSTSP